MTPEEYIKSKTCTIISDNFILQDPLYHKVSKNVVEVSDAYTAIRMARNEAINSGWHDATEKPKLGELIIVEVYGKIWDYGKYDVCDTIHPKARWAYVKDLLPKEDER